jgi:DNA repair protein RadC
MVCCCSTLKAEAGAGEMAQQVRALTALPKVLSSNPSNHIVAHNHPSLDLTPSSGASEVHYSVLMYNNKYIFGPE